MGEGLPRLLCEMTSRHLDSLESALGTIFPHPHLARGVLLSPKKSFPGQCSAPSHLPSAASSGRVPASAGTVRTCEPGRAPEEVAVSDSECLGDRRVPHKDSDLLIYSREQPRSQFNWSHWHPWDGNRCFVGLCLCVSWNSLPRPQLGTLLDSQVQMSFRGSYLVALEGPGYVIERPCVCVGGHSHAPSQNS